MNQNTAGETLLAAIAYGDATGLPYEKKDPLQPGTVTELPQLLENDFIEIPQELKAKRGLWSDDTHLSLASAISLIRSNGFDLEDQARAQVEAYTHVKGDESQPDLVPAIVTQSRRNGYGGSTVNSFERLADGVSPLASGEKNGAGNGVLMKMAPLVYWQYMNNVDSDEAMEQVTDFTKMTHAAPEAVVCSQVHRKVLLNLLDLAPGDPSALKSLYIDALNDAREFEDQLGVPSNTSDVLARIEDSITFDFPAPLDRNLLLENVEKGGFYAPETLLMAYANFLLEPDPLESVYRATELGGDSDSVASIVATMSNFYHGGFEAPDIGEVFAIERLQRISQQLVKTARQCFEGLFIEDI